MIGIEKGRLNEPTFRRQNKLLPIGYQLCVRDSRMRVNICPGFLHGILDG